MTSSVHGNRRFGKGPYTRTRFGDGAEFSLKLKETAELLRNAAQTEDWNIDWETLDGFHSQAGAALAAGKPTEAIRFYSRSLSFLMDQLRNQDAESSSIDLEP